MRRCLSVLSGCDVAGLVGIPRALARACERSEGAAVGREDVFEFEPGVAATTGTGRLGRGFISVDCSGVPGWVGVVV